MIKHICFIINKYPNRVEPNVCVFIQQLVWSIADMGIKCDVIVPMPVNLNREYFSFPASRVENNENGKEITIYHPKYISMGQQGRLAQKARVSFTTMAYEKAVDSVLSEMKVKPDALYAHFICPSGVVAARLGRKYSIPSFMAHGEATYSGDAKYGNKKLAHELRSLAGLVAVSTQNKDYCVNAGLIDERKCGVFPNGYRTERFSQKDKGKAREKFGWDKESFIVGFCGSFDERKGILRLQEAVDSIEGVQFACAGKGKQIPTSSKCIFSKPVNNDELAWFYSALDAFCLPTQHEGCCNAIVEAIACGCPIISADKSFNYDICDESNSILVDPNDVAQIKNAIDRLHKEPAVRERLSSGSLKKAERLTLTKRAQSIIRFINNAVAFVGEK